MKEWEGLMNQMKKYSENAELVDSRMRILIKNMFTVRENKWEKGKEEGPLKLKDLHKKVQRELEGYDEYEEPQ
jgi:hypothetical protein